MENELITDSKSSNKKKPDRVSKKLNISQTFKIRRGGRRGKFLILLFYFSIIYFFVGLNFKDTPPLSGWYQQFFPNMNGSTIASLTFLDSLTGYAVTNTNTSNQCYILKTSNGGDNWNIIYIYNSGANIHFTKIQFANSNIGYASTNFYNFFKTTDAGLDWIQLSTPDGAEDMAVINIDTILVVTSDGFAGGVFRSTNGGLNWSALGPTGGSGQPYNIYMFNKDIGFCLGGQMRKTTNGGVNWFVIPNESYSGIQFIDSLTGWKSWDSIKKTTNGGLNWFSQQFPNLGFYFSSKSSFSILNKDSLWMVGREYYSRPPVFKSTNGGTNWGYQIPDTTLQTYSFNYISFVNKKAGWIYPMSNIYEMHTITGGNDTTFYTEIKNHNSSTPKNFELKQNYPNPYNSSTLIEYYINTQGWVKLKIFDITGKEVVNLVNEVQSTGGYGIPVSVNLSSGVYFYRLQFTTRSGDIQTETRKMMMIK